jgi:hypothetical protein
VNHFCACFAKLQIRNALNPTSLASMTSYISLPENITHKNVSNESYRQFIMLRHAIFPICILLYVNLIYYIIAGCTGTDSKKMGLQKKETSLRCSQDRRINITTAKSVKLK